MADDSEALYANDANLRTRIARSLTWGMPLPRLRFNSMIPARLRC